MSHDQSAQGLLQNELGQYRLSEQILSLLPAGSSTVAAESSTPLSLLPGLSSALDFESHPSIFSTISEWDVFLSLQTSAHVQNLYGPSSTNDLTSPAFAYGHVFDQTGGSGVDNSRVSGLEHGSGLTAPRVPPMTSPVDVTPDQYDLMHKQVGQPNEGQQLIINTSQGLPFPTIPMPSVRLAHPAENPEPPRIHVQHQWLSSSSETSAATLPPGSRASPHEAAIDLGVLRTGMQSSNTTSPVFGLHPHHNMYLSTNRRGTDFQFPQSLLLVPERPFVSPPGLSRDVCQSGSGDTTYALPSLSQILPDSAYIPSTGSSSITPERSTHTRRDFTAVHRGYRCPRPGCGKVITRKVNLRDHINRHDGTKPYNCRNGECPQRFAGHHDRNRHERRFCLHKSSD